MFNLCQKSNVWSLSEVCLKYVRSLKTARCLSEICSPKSGVCQKSKICYLKSETKFQTPKSEVWNLPKVCPKSYICKVWSPKFEVWSHFKFVWSLKSKVCLKAVRSLSKVWIPKSVWLSPKYMYYAQSLSEVWPLKTEFWSPKLIPKFKIAEKNA